MSETTTNTTKVVTMTEDELRAYTERAVRTALEETRPSRAATMQHLRATRLELDEVLRDLERDRYVQRWRLTAADERALQKVEDDLFVLDEGITQIRHSIAHLRTAITRLERAGKRHRDRLIAKRDKNAVRRLAQIEKDRAKHLAEVSASGSKHKKSCQRCQELDMEAAAVRIVSTAPPFSTEQILEIRRALYG